MALDPVALLFHRSRSRVIGKPSIVPGVVVHMDPETLIAEGGSTNAPNDIRVQDVHYFICLVRDEDVVGRVSEAPSRVVVSEDSPVRETWRGFSAFWSPALFGGRAIFVF